MIAEKVVEADMIVFATPVYWWGITAQIKMVLDKLYCMAVIFTGRRSEADCNFIMVLGLVAYLIIIACSDNAHLRASSYF